MNIHEKVQKIQIELKAPKGQWNDHGKYHYRSSEDILEGLKPLLDEYGVVINISDEIINIGDRYYVKAYATISDTKDPEQSIVSTAYAREPEQQKGMNAAQLTGSSSSYARKYALNGLLAIDDTKDADFEHEGKGPQPQPRNPAPESPSQPITKEQAWELFNDAGGRNNIVKEVMETFGYKRSTDIKSKDFAAVKAAIRGMVEEINK